LILAPTFLLTAFREKPARPEEAPMPRIPDEILERVKHEVSVVVLAERAGVELKKVGHELMARCPFPPHEDSTPSLSINPERNVFRCFGCGVAGTSIDWVKSERRVEFREAVEWLLWEFFPSVARGLLGERRAEAETEPRRLSRRSRAPELPCPFDFEGDDAQLLLEYVDHCHALLLESAEAQDYLKKRGLDDAELVSRFRLGYQDRSLGLRLPERAAKGGNIRDRFQRLGLIRESGHAHFVGSVLVPTLDLAGNVAGIYGRKTRDDLNRKHASPKHLYLAGPDCDVFNEDAFVDSKEIVLCEARIDALSFWRHGIKNVTACRGVHLSDALLDAFVRHGTERCYIAFDRDQAGEAGAVKAAEKLMAAGVECFRVLFPKGMDANEVTMKMQPADKTLALFVRSAEWIGGGKKSPSGGSRTEAHESRARQGSPVALEDPSDVPSSVAREAALEPEPIAIAAPERPSEATEEGGVVEVVERVNAPTRDLDEAAEERSSIVTRSETSPASPSPSLPPSPARPPELVKLTDDEAELLFDDRRYRIRGLSKCLAYGSLRITLKVERQGVDFSPPSPLSGWHLDTVDLCSHRQRGAFEKEASRELALKPELLRFDLGKIVRLLETLQEERIAAASQPKRKLVTLTDAEIDEAKAFWRSPDLFGRIADDYTKCGLVGELVNKIAAYVGASSRLLDRPLAIIIQSSSAAGKSTLMEKTLALMPEEMKEKYTAVSGKSLFYLDEGTVLSHKILAIVEEEGAEKATYPLKILQSEGELVMASTGKDPHSGKLVTKIYKVEGPVMILLTTTSIELDPELENRCLRITVDESREQTRAIHELQRMRMTYEGHLLAAERERIQKLHQNAQRLLRRLRVHNPYARHLTFVSDQTRTRRDHDKYLALIETIALMHQFQRPIYRRKVAGIEEEYVDVTLGDLELAGMLIGAIVGQSLDGVPPQTRVFLDALDELVTKLSEESGVERADLRFTCRQIRELTGFTEFQVRVHLSRLISLEYVLQHKGQRGHSFVYELLYNGEGKDGRRFVLGLVDIAGLTREAGERSESSTTFHPRGPEGRFEGYSSPVCAPDEAHSSTASSLSKPAHQAALLDPEPRSAENALIPAQLEIGSYAPVVHTPSNGNGHRRLVRFNLLRFPPRPFAPAPSVSDELRRPVLER
jgi:CHC2 zinc finger/Toprim-like/DNA primase catalytic core, N-terminal domain